MTLHHETVRRALNQMNLNGSKAPIWLEAIQKLYPPIRFSPPPIKSHLTNGQRKSILPIPKPPKIILNQDRYRRRLYKTHKHEMMKPVSFSEGNEINIETINDKFSNNINDSDRINDRINSNMNDNSNGNNNSRENLNNSPTIDRVIGIQLEIIKDNPKITIEEAYELALKKYQQEKIKQEIRIKVARQAWNDTVIKMNAYNLFSNATSIIEENLKKEREILEKQGKE